MPSALHSGAITTPSALTASGAVVSSAGYVYGVSQFYDITYGSGFGLGIHGSGTVLYAAGGAIFSASTPGGGGIRIDSGTVLGWTAGHALSSSSDVAFSRIGAATLGLGNGAVGDTGGTLQLKSITLSGVAVTAAYTVATLPAAVAGSIAHVSDSTVYCAKNAAPVGGGSITCPVFYTGAAWVGL